MTDDTLPELPVLIPKDDFLREFGKYMRHNLRLEHDRAAENATQLEASTQRLLERHDVVGALSTSAAAKEQRIKEETLNLCLAMLKTSTHGLGIDPDELKI